MSQKFVLYKDPTRRAVLDDAISFLEMLPDTRAWAVEIKRHVKHRTDPQNAALFGLAYPILEEATGYTKDELHEAFCRKAFGTVGTDVMGINVTRPMRTTTTDENGRRDIISTARFSDFYAMVQQTGAEIGCWIPDPDPWHDR